MKRVGFSRRFPASIVDAIFIFILVVVGIVIYVAVGGARLGLEAQRALGIPVSWNTFANEDVWRQYERRSQEMVSDIERMISEDFTPEQAEFIGSTMEESMENYFSPDQFSVQFFLDLDEDDLDAVVDHAFDSVLAAGRSDLDAADVNALRAEVKTLIREFGVGTILPQAIDFAVWLVFLPVLILLGYGLIEGTVGRSPGKMVTGIVIRRANGDPAYAGTFLLRYALKNAPLLLMVLALILRSATLGLAAGIFAVVSVIGVLVMAGPERRAIYDYIAGTAVFRR